MMIEAAMLNFNVRIYLKGLEKGDDDDRTILLQRPDYLFFYLSLPRWIHRKVLSAAPPKLLQNEKGGNKHVREKKYWIGLIAHSRECKQFQCCKIEKKLKEGRDCF